MSLKYSNSACALVCALLSCTLCANPAPAPETVPPAEPTAQTEGAAPAVPGQTDVAPVEATQPQAPAIKIAVLLPARDSLFASVTEKALSGLLASNYALSSPAEVLLVRAGASDTMKDLVERAAAEGAMAAVGPIDRAAVQELASLEYLPLPVVTLNQIDIDTSRPMTEEERAEYEAQQALMTQGLVENVPPVSEGAPAPAPEPAPAEAAPASQSVVFDGEAAPADTAAAAEPEPTEEQMGRIGGKLKVPGLVLAEDLKQEPFALDARTFPRSLLMLGLSMESDAVYTANLGVRALPEKTLAGEKPKVLLLDHDTPLEKRISQAFERELTALGYAPDRLTVDINEFRRVTTFFDLIVEEEKPAGGEGTDVVVEEIIDQETDPIGWRQQQLRLRRSEAEKRARATFAEPPYQAVFLALDAKTAALIRPRLPIRTRVWGTPYIYPGNPAVDSSVRSLAYDLRQVTFTDIPLVIGFDKATFEETYQVAAPETVMDQRLFALGADALSVALRMAHGETAGTLEGLTGELSFDANASPVILRKPAVGIIQPRSIVPMDEMKAITYQIVSSGNPFLKKKQEPSAELKLVAPAPETAEAPAAAQE